MFYDYTTTTTIPHSSLSVCGAHGKRVKGGGAHYVWPPKVCTPARPVVVAKTAKAAAWRSSACRLLILVYGSRRQALAPQYVAPLGLMCRQEAGREFYSKIRQNKTTARVNLMNACPHEGAHQ